MPEKQQRMIDQIDLSAFRAAVVSQNLAVRGMRVFQNGKLVASYQPQPEQRQNQYSGTKSFTATACAFAIQEGLFSLDDYVLDYFAADAPEEPGENLRKMRLYHLITMSMGFENPMLMGDMRPKMVERDWVKYILGAPVVHEPGSVFQYNNAGPYLLGVLIQRKTGISLVDYLMPRLFDPLEIPRPECEEDPLGYTFGAGGLQLNVSEFSKLGLLYLQKGQWKGKQLISDHWVAEATRTHIRSNEGDDEIGTGYGFQFWTMPNGMFRADGKNGQYCVVIPDKNAVIAINSMQYQNEKDILRAAVRTVLPLL